MPTIDMTATGKNITRMMKAAGMTVKDLQEIFGFATPQGCKIDDLLIVDMPAEGRKTA